MHPADRYLVQKFSKGIRGTRARAPMTVLQRKLIERGRKQEVIARGLAEADFKRYMEAELEAFSQLMAGFELFNGVAEQPTVH